MVWSTESCKVKGPLLIPTKNLFRGKIYLFFLNIKDVNVSEESLSAMVYIVNTYLFIY